MISFPHKTGSYILNSKNLGISVSMALSSCSSLIALGSSENDILIFDRETAKPIKKIYFPKYRPVEIFDSTFNPCVTSMEFSPCCNYIYSVHGTNQVLITNINNNKRFYVTVKDRVFSICLLKDNCVALGSQNGLLFIVDISLKKVISSCKIADGLFINFYNANDRFLIASTYQGEVLQYDFKKRQVVKMFVFPEELKESLRFDNSIAFSGSSVTLIYSEKGNYWFKKTIDTIDNNKPDKFFSLAEFNISIDKKFLMFTYADSEDTLIFEFDSIVNSIEQVGNELYLATDNGEIYRTSCFKKFEIFKPVQNLSFPNDIEFSDCGRYKLIYFHEGLKSMLVDNKTNDSKYFYNDETGNYTVDRFSTDSKYFLLFVTVEKTQFINVIDCATGSIFFSVPLDSIYIGACFLSDRLIVVFWDYFVSYDLNSGDLISETLFSQHFELDYSGQAKRIVLSGSEYFEIIVSESSFLIDPDSGKTLRTTDCAIEMGYDNLDLHILPIDTLEISRCGRYGLVAGGELAFQVFDLASGMVFKHITLNEDPIVSYCFLPDEDYIVCSTRTRKVFLINWRTGDITEIFNKSDSLIKKFRINSVSNKLMAFDVTGIYLFDCDTLNYLGKLSCIDFDNFVFCDIYGQIIGTGEIAEELGVQKDDLTLSQLI
jgi:WD40 repeat protein